MVWRGNPQGARPCVGRVWRRLQDQVYAASDVCWRCGQHVDMALRESNPRHPRAPSVDHAIARKWRPDLALDPANLRLAHYGCNSARGDGLTRQDRQRSRSSRVW